MSVACVESWAHRFPASERREHLTRNLLVVARSEEVSPADAAALRAEAVLLNRVLALAVAHRYHHRGVEDDDVDQVAMVGLCLAVERWDPMAATPFVAFAMPTISGEIKRHFRDRAWLVRPPRSLQNRVAEVRAAGHDLRAELRREPSREEIAACLDVDVEVVDAARVAGDAFHGSPLERDDAPTAPTPWLVSDDSALLDSLADSVDLRRAVQQLSERDRRLLKLRFVDEMTQQEVGRALGVSQMQVSRLLARLLTSLRHSLELAPDDDGSLSDAPVAQVSPPDRGSRHAA